MEDAINTSFLISCFFSSVEESFLFLEDHFRFRRVSGIAMQSGGRIVIVPYDGSVRSDIFWAVVRYEKDNLAIEIAYGDRNLVIEGHVYYGHIQRLSFEDILLTADICINDNEQAIRVASADVIGDTIRRLAGLVRQHKRHFLKYDPDMVDAVATLRARLLGDEIMRQHKNNVEQISLLGAKAYQEKDYKRVIELFRPYETYLSPADFKKLQAARALFLKHPVH